MPIARNAERGDTTSITVGAETFFDDVILIAFFFRGFIIHSGNFPTA